MARKKLIVPQYRLVQDKPDADGKAGLWHVSYTDPVAGYTRKRGTGTRDRGEAEKLMPGIVSSITLGQRTAAGPVYQLSALLDAYERAKCREGKNSTYYALKPLRAFFAGFVPEQLNDVVWTAYRDQRCQQHNGSAPFLNKTKSSKPPKLVSDATACKELNVMRGAISWARRNGWKGLDNVTVHVEDQPDYAVQEYLRREEVVQLLDACIEPHTELFVLIALATGARMSAILELEWSAVHWPHGREPVADDAHALVFVERPERPHIPWEGTDFDLELRPDSAPLRLDLGRGRGNKKRGTGVITRTNSRLYLALKQAWLDRVPGCDHVVSFRGAPVRKVNLEPAYARAGLPYKRCNHILKHTCCSLLVQAGASFESVGKLVGTRAEMIRKTYGHLSPEHLETVGAVLSF